MKKEECGILVGATHEIFTTKTEGNRMANEIKKALEEGMWRKKMSLQNSQQE